MSSRKTTSGAPCGVHADADEPGDEADQDARPDRAEQVADPAEDDDGEDEADPLEGELREDGLVDPDQHAGDGAHRRRRVPAASIPIRRWSTPYAPAISRS